MSVPITVGKATRRHEFLVMNLGLGLDGILSWSWLQEAKAKLNVAQGLLTMIDKLGMEHEQPLTIKEQPGQPNHAAYRFQKATVTFQICTARQFEKQVKTADEAWVVVIEKSSQEQEEDEKVASLPIHPEMQALIDKY
ncbi:hypothetical protein R1flu_014160 [Riccia fluitans]|uniref:Uncharacterized protein n=1 Tax=Riccia fluitans TaxID=41844 RepID=A0ABD1YGE2_9MARC